ncbi:MAG: hypothetical protein ACREF7_02385, partial [Candidatus Saccharimonadales bacterium]
IVTIIAIVLVASLFSYTEVQKSQINSLSNDIRSQGLKLSNQANINSILTIQNQIQTLTTLHEQEPNVTNLATYLNQAIPVTTNLSSLSVDFNADTMIMSGNADTLVTINQLVDSLKFATYSVKGVSGSKPAFSNVVLADFGLTNGVASFTINLSFDPILFNNTETVTLNVPSKVTTRSQLDQPITLFNQSPTSGSNG